MRTSALSVRPQTAVGSGSAPAVYPQVTELARALKYNPDLIYEYVHNDIQTIPLFGSLKGPFGTVIDGSGTAFDQAELMVQLLQLSAGQANSTVSNPQIAVGQIHLTASQVQSWLGTSSVSSASTILAAAGFSPTVTASSGDTLASVDIWWAWVTVQISGTTYAFDPSTKTYTQYQGYGASGTFAANSGFSQSQLVNDFGSGQSG